MTYNTAWNDYSLQAFDYEITEYSDLIFFTKHLCIVAVHSEN